MYYTLVVYFDREWTLLVLFIKKQLICKYEIGIIANENFFLIFINLKKNVSIYRLYMNKDSKWILSFDLVIF